MRKIAVIMVAVVFAAGTAQAAGKKDLAKQLDDSFDKVQSAYFKAGFAAGATCGMTVATDAREKAADGIAVSSEEMLAEIEKCEAAAKKKYKVK